jgi:hypothetical protein
LLSPSAKSIHRNFKSRTTQHGFAVAQSASMLSALVTPALRDPDNRVWQQLGPLDVCAFGDSFPSRFATANL